MRTWLVASLMVVAATWPLSVRAQDSKNESPCSGEPCSMWWALTEPDRPVIAARHGCNERLTLTIALLTKPKHGTVVLCRGVNTSKDDCGGKRVPHIQIWYIPDAGFSGRDAFEYTANSPNNSPPSPFYYMQVNVRPGPPHSQPETICGSESS